MALNKFKKQTPNAEKKKAVDQLFADVRAEECIRLEECETRNVIFVGKTRSGKSTSVEVLKDVCHLAQTLGIFSDTRETQVRPFTVKYHKIDDEEKKMEGKSYNINIIDTPGLFETRKDQTEKRDNIEIIKMIQTCMQFEITKIHAIVFVCSFVEGIKKEDIDAFKIFLELFAGATSKVVMLITRAESMPEKEKIKLIESVKEHEDMKHLIEQITEKANKSNPRIFFMGALSQSLYDNADLDGIGRVLIELTTMRAALFEYLFAQEKDGIHLQELEIVKKAKRQQEKLAQDFQMLTEEYQKLTEEQKRMEAEKIRLQKEYEVSVMQKQKQEQEAANKIKRLQEESKTMEESKKREMDIRLKQEQRQMDQLRLEQQAMQLKYEAERSRREQEESRRRDREMELEKQRTKTAQEQQNCLIQ